MRDLHSALKTYVLNEFQEEGIHYKVVRLQYGKDDFIDSIHAQPSSFSLSGLQTTDFLHFLGFKRSPCAFFDSECYVKEIKPNTDTSEFTKSISKAYVLMLEASGHLYNCGININQPEGWGYFNHKPPSNRIYPIYRSSGNGHVAAISKRMKASKDEYFNFVLTWIEGAYDKGWAIHYRAKHMPLSGEFLATLDFLGGFSIFDSCPEFNFESCWWRFIPFRVNERSDWLDNTETVHSQFDLHRIHFSQGLKKLLDAHKELKKHGISFLQVRIPIGDPTNQIPTSMEVSTPGEKHKLPFIYDVAISYSSAEKELADRLANHIKKAGFSVFYDGFYPEQLWGKDLASYFDQIYRKHSRFCVMFISKQYAESMWTTFERKSAQARAIEEKGNEYILPIRIDDTELEGLSPTIGFLSISQYSIDYIAELLIKKLRT
jgi:hypothetical protein